jgi:hypothetical protein
MNKLLGLALLLLAVSALAQTPSNEGPPPRDSMEPGVNTSTPAAAPPRDAMEPGVDTSAPGTAPQQVPAATPPPAATKPKPATSSAAANKPPAKSNAKDRLDLDSTQITGNRELPKVLYIVPWRSAELGDLVGRPVNSLLDEVLEPVDRDVFRRQNRYFEALQPNEAVPAGKSEK